MTEHINPKVQKIIDRDTLKQRTANWYSARNECITASAVASLLVKDNATCDEYIETYGLQDVFLKDGRCANPYGSKTQFYLDKCRPSRFKGNLATHHGIKYEPVINDFYMNLHNTKILDFGLIKHETIKWLAASPDGITPDGIMIEIKCPMKRKITGTPPFYYYLQVQHQLFVCDLDECDFVEAECIEFMTEEEWLDDKTLDYNIFAKGIMIEINSLDSNGLPIFDMAKYIYPPRELLSNETELIKWKEDELEKLYSYGKKNINILYWKIIDLSIVRIKRSNTLFEHIIPVLEKEWKLVQFYKKNENWKLLEKNKSEDINKNVFDLSTGNVVKQQNQGICFLSDSEDEENN